MINETEIPLLTKQCAKTTSTKTRMFNQIRNRTIIAKLVQRRYFGIEKIRNAETRRKKSTNIKSTESEFRHPREHHIPNPTWSLQDLELTSTHTSIPEEELKRLTKLVLVDLFENDEYQHDDKLNLMKQDLGNMLHMIQHVTKYDYKESIRNGNDDLSDTDFEKGCDTTADATTYDTARGLKKGMPLRKEIELDPLQTEDATQAQNVLEKLNLRMVNRGGGHKYFAIETAEK